ncbi:hypothetical protein CVS40_10512 [Lucilia cuprina]|nr:hypothetical protein CVS40_10512 [Lucilia cuprina]
MSPTCERQMTCVECRQFVWDKTLLAPSNAPQPQNLSTLISTIESDKEQERLYPPFLGPKI